VFATSAVSDSTWPSRAAATSCALAHSAPLMPRPPVRLDTYDTP
jgi:hypothetical protein